MDWPFESFPEYLKAVENRETAINVAALTGHMPLRLYTMGDDAMEREATAAEVAEMSALVRDSIAAGALGFSTAHAATQNAYDGRPIPSRLACFGEVDALVGAMTEAGGNVVQCSIGKDFFHYVMTELARRHKIPITWTALVSGMSGPGSHRKHLQLTAEQRAEGLDITPQVACRPVMFDFDLAFDLSLESDFAARVRLPFLNYDHDEVGELLCAEDTELALSDAGAHASQLCDACYSTHFLGHWVRDEGIMEMEQAVHRLTQRPADIMGITDRGRLGLGLPADIVVFDPATVGASGLSRVYDQPGGQDRLIAKAIGIQAVIVNGVPIRENGNDTVNPDRALPGQPIRANTAA